MLEWYRANAGVDDVMRDTEQLVAAVTGGAVAPRRPRASTCGRPSSGSTVCDAFERFAGWSSDGDARGGGARRGPLLPRAGRRGRARARDARSRRLPRRLPRHAGVARAQEAGRSRAWPSASSSTWRASSCATASASWSTRVEQRARLEHDQAARRARGLPVYPIDERFLEALARVPPSGGNALGLDRLVALACGTTDIADVVAFTADEL